MYIEPHNDPGILKLEIRMALYEEKKPDKNDYYPDPDQQYFDDAMYNRDLRYWSKSRIAYLKEPEFKVGDIGHCIRITEHTPHWMRKPGIIEEVRKDSILINFAGWSGFVLKEDFSHYYPGQEVESFKYVREVEKVVEGWHPEIDGVKPVIHQIEWQEVEEPAEAPNWDEKDKDRETHAKWHLKYTQFQADKKQAEILAEI